MCGKHYETFEAFVRETRPIGVLPDLTDVDDPLGFLSLANCACGTTIALKCEDAATHAAFLAALGRESSSSKRSATEVLTELRDEVRGLAMRQG